MHDTSKFNLSISGFSGIPQVHSFELSEGILGDDLLAVHFIADSDLSGSVVGSEASFSFEHEGRKEYFSGVITSCRIKQSASGISTVALAVKTLRHLLDREKKRAVFCDSDVEEIAKKILGKARILNVRCDLKSFYKTDLKVQHNESDLAFLQRLFEECGIAEYVRHSGKGSELVISDSNDFEASDPSFADSELETTESGNVFHGIGHVPVRPGVEFEAFVETFVVCSASHSGSQGAAYGVEMESEGYSCQITAYPKVKLGSLPRRRKPPLHSPGVMTATVEGFSDSPAYLDSEGRYIIRLPFDVESQDMASCIPVHLMQNFAGEGGGIHFPLRKDTPVLVAFEDGSMEKPVILGAIPRDTHRSPSTEDNSFQNVVRTSSGIELVFDDRTKSLGISAPEGISAKAGKEMALEGGEKLILASGGVKISLDSSGVLKMDAPGDITVKSSGTLALQGDTVELGGPSSPSPDAGAGSAAGTSSLQRQATGSGGSSNSVVPQGMAPQNAAAGVAQQRNASSGTASQYANADDLLIPEPNGEKRPIFKIESNRLDNPIDAEEFNKYEAAAQFIDEEFANDDELTNGNKNKEKNKRNYCYKSMIDKLNGIKNATVGPLLRKAWKKYENKLKVGNYNLRDRTPYNINGAIYVNIKKDILANDTQKGNVWLEPYHYIFHEFFHTILRIAILPESTFHDFGRIIISDINDANGLLREENNISIKSTDKRLNNLTYRRLRGKSYAVLFDIIGGVLYRGKYGCYPPNSQFYTHDGKPCRDKNMCKCVINCSKCKFPCCTETRRITRANRILGCNYIIESNIADEEAKFSHNPRVSGLHRCTNEKDCIFKENEYIRHDYKMECKFENNCWISDNGCYKLWGHGPDYWGPKTTPPTLNFLYSLADEAFAQMAAEAIANPTAYEYIVKYLPQSYEKFKEILKTLS